MTSDVFQEAARRLHLDPVLYYRAADIVDTAEARITTPDGEVLRYSDGDPAMQREKLALAAAVALVLTERSPGHAEEEP